MKLLYNNLTQKILSYPRNDDSFIVGLDSNLIVLDQIDTDPPIYDPTTQYINSDYEINLETNEYVQVWELVDKEPIENWDGFNSEMLADEEFNFVYSTANSISPVLCASLPAALTQVSDGKVSMFNLVWNSIMQLGGATQAQRNKWGQWAENYNLPLSFINIIFGNSV